MYLSPTKSSPPEKVTLPPLVALVGRDATAEQSLSWIRQEGYSAELFSSVSQVLAHGEAPLVVCLDVDPEESEGLESLQLLRSEEPELSVIVLGPRRDAEAAVAAMRAGAQDYIPRPLERRRLLAALSVAVEQHRVAMARQNSSISPNAMSALVGDSAPMRRVASKVRRVLRSDVAVCVRGEPGTGKETTARFIHFGSARKGPLVVVSCLAVPESEHERELFGETRAGLDSTVANSVGRFHEAAGGTLVIREVERLSLSAQVSLLRMLQDGRDSGEEARDTNVRVVSTTVSDLRLQVEAGNFREDLFFRLVVYPIELPSLKQRRADIPLLVGHFLKQFGERGTSTVDSVEPDALRALMRHPWSGNITELRHVLERSVLACASKTLRLASLPAEFRPSPVKLARPSLPAIEQEHDEIVPLRELERRAIRRALKAANGSVARAAKLLGIGRATLYRRLSSLGGDHGAA